MREQEWKKIDQLGVIQAGDDGGLEGVIAMAGGEKWLNAGYLEKRQQIGLASGIAVDAREREMLDDCHVFGLWNW